MSRILVTGRYLNKGTYVLYMEDGSEYKTIKEGEPFKIDNQLRYWYPVRVPKKNGKGTILMCQKYGSDGTVMTQFPLIHNKKGWWATSSGSARKGVFHTYIPPKNSLEEKLAELRTPARVIEKVDEDYIEKEVETKFYPKWRNYIITDGNNRTVEILHDLDGKYSGEARKVNRATYMICYSANINPIGVRTTRITTIYMSRLCDEERVIKALSNEYK